MRTIKFRGRRIDNNEWVYGYLYSLQLPNGEACMILTQDNNHLDNSLKPKYHLAFTLWVDLFIVNPVTVGQFTSLYDKNGKEIYEGDILRYPAEDKFDEENFVSFEVFWHDNDCADNHVGWQMDRHHFHGNICGARELSRFLPKYTNKMVVIGNIHDNPELL